MMMFSRIRTAALAALLAGFTTFAQAGGSDETLAPFPQAEDGQQRFVLHLRPRDDESLHKIELIVGRMVETDAHNKYFLGGEIQALSISGWGYTRYVVDKVGPMAGTLMAVDPNADKIARFITLGGPPYLVRYNSRLPIVVYVPDGVEVRYRLWSGDSKTKPLNPG